MNMRTTQMLISPATAAALLAGSAHAALVEVGNTQWNDNNSREISVFSGNAYLDVWLGNPGPSVNTVKNLGAVAEYNFFNEAGTSNLIGSYASSGSRIGLATTTDSGIANQKLITNALYTTSDPTGGTPDFTANTHVNGLGGSTTGSIDVTGLQSGTLFFIFGSNAAEGRATSLTVTQGASVVTTAQSGGGYFQSGGTGFWANGDTISVAVEVDFTNGGSDNTINYDFSTNNAGKFMGVVLSDVVVPEPGSLALISLGGLCVLRRRQK